MAWIKTNVNSNITSKWSGKTILAIGDSITDLNTPETKYITFIGQSINATIVNNGVSGSGYMCPTAITGRISGLTNNADLIYVFAGTNDYGNNGGYALGTFGDTTTSTFYGAVDTVFTSLIAKYPLKTIAVITPLPRQNGMTPNSLGFTLKDYATAVKTVANKYSLPVLDLFNGSSYFPDNATFRANYNYGGNGASGGDGLHPNTAWHQNFLAGKVLSFINTL